MKVINTWLLDKQARLIVEEIPYLRSAALGVYIKLGSRHEKEEIAGASHFIEHMLFKGTESRSARDIAESFEEIGGQLNAFTSKEYTCVYARTLDENISSAMEIIFDMLFNSNFAPRDFATEKEVIIEEINIYEDTPDDLIHDLFARNLWQGHPMGSPILGTLDSVSAFSRDEIFAFYKKCYVPSNMVIAVAGNVDKNLIRDQVERSLAQQPVALVDWPRPNPTAYSNFVRLLEKETEQVQICLGVPGISYFDQNRYVQNVMNSILGGGMSSRLFQKIREELGLAYSVYSSPSTYSDTGSYSFYIGTGANKIATFFEALYNELEFFVSRGVSEREVRRTQQLIKSSMYLGLESVMNRMSRLGKSLMMYDRVIPIEDVINEILAVDSKKVQGFSSGILQKPAFSLAAIGPADVLPQVEKEFCKWWG
ncbi:MAG: pitrilysin family protein [Syntrophomonas sp.]|uniref:M16 family metallopeptidase n=1 Tax=Syntrophomonas sp. TaxID=2053627 RepID=UPI0026216176|nr:pitrilysin family protein [Syntrophomonas sp.]MDD2511107.1 pitrilysin family protein [Syntrophomonas sp.]MDD4627255.1 pitrilysin family protein [Syntrophomonas sp.]